MTTEQITEVVNKAKSFGDATYNSIKISTTAGDSYRICNDASVGYFDDANEVVVVFRISQDVTRNNMVAPPIEVCYVTYDDISKIVFFIDGKDLAAKRSEFHDLDQDKAMEIAKLAANQNFGGGFADNHKPDLSAKKPGWKPEEKEKPLLGEDEVIGAPSMLFKR